MPHLIKLGLITVTILSASGKRTDLDADASRFTWSGYCSEIGIDYTTAKIMHGTFVPRMTWDTYCEEIGIEK